MTRIKALVNVFAILAAGIAFFWAATPTLATASNCGEIVATAAPGLETAIEIPVVILGAGPGGLSVAYELSKRLPMTAVLTIDQGERPGDTWRRRMPSDFPLVTRWEHSALEGPFGNRFPNAEQVSAKDFADYLERYAHSVVPRVRTNTAVYAVSKQLDGRLRLETSTGVIIAKQVVNATGNFSKPELPQLPGRLESAIPQMHSSEYLGEEQLRALGIPIGAKQPILVVGNGTSAAQLLYALSKSGYNVALSLRTGVAGAEQSSKDLLLS
ncbi:MAG TPA: NAD(P)/FAD-dependent oxidoreductase, partial [Oligoflexia bacterium]|nr:NAD(P)/FAD-dependent oxidoreductase [Oligoflexia bacterium]